MTNWCTSNLAKEIQRIHGISSISLDTLRKSFANYDLSCNAITFAERQKCRKNILLSICIPTRNRANYIYELVLECLKINSDKIEVVVLDNRSSDKTEKLLSQIWDKRFHYYRNKEQSKEYAHCGECIAKAEGKFALLLSDNDSIPNIKEWFEKTEDILEKSKDTTTFRGFFKDTSGKIIGNIPKAVCKEDTLEAYEQVINGSTWASSIIFPKKTVKKYFAESKQIAPYFGIVYPHLNIMFCCAKYGDIAPLETLSVQQRKNVVNHDPENALPTISDENSYSLKSRKIQSFDIVKLLNNMNFSDDVKIPLLEDAIIKQCDWINSAFAIAYSKEDEISLRYQSYEFVYWHYEFWASFMQILKEIETLCGVSEITLNLFEKVFNRYEKLCKMIDDKKAELEKSEEVKN